MAQRPTDPAVIVAFTASLAQHDPATLRAYRTVLRDFITWRATMPDGTPFQVAHLTATAVRAYLEHLTAAGKAPRTRSKALTALQRFGRWTVEAELLPRNPVVGVTRPTVSDGAPKELSPEQRFVLHALVERAGSPRIAAIVGLGYWAALRISEVAALRLADCTVNQRAGSLTILDGKGGKTRTLDLHNAARRALAAYLDDTASKEARDIHSAYLFTSQRAASRRQQSKPDHLSARGIDHCWHQLKALATHTEWPYVEHITFHDLRHDWAHRARAAGWHLEEIAVYAGHQTKDGMPAIATTVRYTLPTRQQLKLRIAALGE